MTIIFYEYDLNEYYIKRIYFLNRKNEMHRKVYFVIILRRIYWALFSVGEPCCDYSGVHFGRPLQYCQEDCHREGLGSGNLWQR